MKDKNSQNGFTPILALSAAVAFLIGLIGGYFFGEQRVQAKYEELIALGVYSTSSGSGTPVTGNTGTDSDVVAPSEVWDQIDYSQFYINSSTTVQDYYSDNETRFYASNLLGQTLPAMEWTDSTGTVHTTAEYASGKYILEFFSSTCQYCNASAAEVDAFRENTGYTIISLCLDDGDLANFNQTGEHAWRLGNESDSSLDPVLANVPWIPCFIYVEDNVIQMVTYGGVSEAQLQAEWNTAFAD